MTTGLKAGVDAATSRRADMPASHHQQHPVLLSASLITLREAAELAHVSKATLYRRAADDPSFPRLIRIGSRCTRVRASDLAAWIASKIEE